MKYSVSENIEDIVRIYPEIFISSFPKKDFEEKLDKGYKIFPVKFISENKLVGFCLVLDKMVNDTLHCWIGGVHPQYRKLGIFGDFLEWIIAFATESGYKFVTLNTDNSKPDIIRLVVKYGFNIVGVGKTRYGDGNKIFFRYDIFQERKMRLSITDGCNFDCFFCHSEGNFSQKNNKISLAALELLLIQAQKMNFTEITITGGEPLVYFEGVTIILTNCNKWIHPPKIKICTNGILLDDEKIQEIKTYRGQLEFNISFHTYNSEKMKIISGNDIAISEYDRIFALLRNYKIKYRVNAVVLKGINDSKEALHTYFDYAIKNNISDVHLLELLVTKNQTELIKHYVNIDEMEKKIQSLSSYYTMEKMEETKKKRVWLLCKDDKILKVVLYRLSCRCGCEDCIRENDIKIGADMILHPCYIEGDADCGNAVDNLKKAIECRDKFISTRNSQYFENILYWDE